MGPTAALVLSYSCHELAGSAVLNSRLYNGRTVYDRTCIVLCMQRSILCQQVLHAPKAVLMPCVFDRPTCRFLYAYHIL